MEFIFHREVIVGEYVVGEDPDCERGRCSPPIQKFGVDKVIAHEKWDSGKNGFLKGNDIALVRVDKTITLFTVSVICRHNVTRDTFMLIFPFFV